MKKYTKKLVAFLLATAMVLTSLPMNAQEVKAADEIVYDFTKPTAGISHDGATIISAPTQTGISYLTTSFAGENWVINPEKTDVPFYGESTEIYNLCGTSSVYTTGAAFQIWSNINTGLRYTQVSSDHSLAFDITVPTAGEYVVSIGYNDRTNYSGAKLTVNDTYIGESPAGTASGNNANTYTFETTATLTEGTNTLIIQNANTGKNYKSPVMFDVVTFTPAAGYGSASINLTEAEQFLVGDTRDLVTTATLSNGTDITSDITVTYASSDNGVATVTDNVLKIVGEGNATITATVTYNGAVAEVVTRNISSIVEGTFWFDFTAVDETTLLNDSNVEAFIDAEGTHLGSNRLYTTAATKSVEGIAVPWTINAELTGADALCTGVVNEKGTGLNGAAGRFFNKPGNITNLRIMAGNVPIAFDFEAPAAGEYNLSAEVVIGGEKFGYGAIFVNDEYVGSVDCYTGMPENQKLLSATVNEGTNTLKVIAAGHSAGTDDYVAFTNIKFSPVEAGTGRKATALDLTVDNVELDMAGTKTAQASITASADDDVIILGDYNYVSSNEDVAVVARTGKITAKSAGTTDITTTIGGLTDTVTLTVNDSRPRYTITWLNEDGTELEVDDNLLEGAAISYDGETPVKEGTAQYSYTFAGWTPEVAETVTGDATYTATYTETVNEYTVTWMVNGEPVKEETLAYGSTPTAPEVNDLEIDGVSYEFLGWDAEIVAVTGDVTYTAVFEEAVQNYTITFVDEDGTPLYETTVAAGELPIYKGDEPTKVPTAQYTYTFAGWTPEVVEATVGATYTATYNATVNNYTVTWVVDGKEIPETYAYGATPEFKGVAEKAKDAQYTYTFTGWDKDIVAVTGDVTYEAQFDATVNKYMITFVDEDGTELKAEEVAYGEVPACEAPSKAEDVYATYTFAGWTPEVVAVTGETKYQATYEATPKSYTVTWVVDGAETTETYEAGKTPEFKGSTDKAADAHYEYTFAGWDPELAEVTADATYTAQYTQTPVTYTITWVNHNGETIATDELVWGATPEAPVATYKEYTFLNWDVEVVAVEGDATYTAVYDIDGIDEGYYYVDGILQSENAQLIKIGEDLYYVQHSGAIKKDGNQTISKIRTNGYVEAGTYYFNADGVMINPADDLSGEIGEDGYYYVKGEVRKNVGLVQIDGYYYYVQYSGKVAKGQNMTVPASQLNDYEVEAGTYYFFANGVMETEEVRMSGSVVDGKYYVFGELRKDAGLVELANGDFIFVQYSGNVRQSGFQTIKEATCNGHTEYIGIKKFAEGVMVK